MIVNNSLKDYIKKNIYLLYKDNFIGDGVDRIDYVIKRSDRIIEENNLQIDNDILYTAISYHDIRVNNEEKNHELISADIMFKDDFLKNYFSEEQRTIIKEAIEDQRANAEKEPRNIYGKILSSASRNSSVEQCLKRSYFYGKKKNPDFQDEKIFEESYNALLKKFGKNGYAKFYFKDSEYEKFLENIREVLEDKDKFISTQKSFIDRLKRNGDF